MFTNILVGVDGRRGGRDAIALAMHLAGPESKITLAHVYGGDWLPGRGATLALAAERREAARLLADEQERCHRDVDVALCGDMPTAHALRALVRQTQADLLVVGSCRHGSVGRVLIGDDACAALAGAACAVAVAPRGYNECAHRLATVGVGYDDSTESHAALALARDLAGHEHAEIRALWVVSLEDVGERDPAPADWAETAAAIGDERRRRLEDLDDVDGTVEFGGPREELARFGQEVDLLIVGSRGYGPVGRLFHGGVSRYLVRHAPCPLVVLPRAARDERAPAGVRDERTVLA